MKLLAIETSCDETAVALIESDGSFPTPTFTVLGNALFSQVDLHAEFGGVYPHVAKREHAKRLVPLTIKVLRDAGMYSERMEGLNPAQMLRFKELFEREPELFRQFAEFYSAIQPPGIDAIAVTHGPGLEPALWVGINFARALSESWDVPLVPVNHMEGHVLSSVMQEISQTEYRIPHLQFPAVSLLVSGGHTELVLIKDWLDYTIIGNTRDDAVGEAFDKVARMLELPYPGGPEISKLAAVAREENVEPTFSLPRPMLDTDNLDFSFSGLKTAVLYLLKKQDTVTDEFKKQVAREFEDAVVEVLVKKTRKAVEEYHAATTIIGGGVSANARLREALTEEFTDLDLFIPPATLTTDNALMIAAAGAFRFHSNQTAESEAITAHGTLPL